MSKKVFSLLLFSFTFLGISCLDFSNDEEHILPSNFTGVVFIIHKQGSGKQEQFKSRKTIYYIPATGILQTQEVLMPKLRQISYYYSNSYTASNKKELKYIWDLNSWSNDSVCVFGHKVGKRYKDGKEVKYVSYMVGTKKQVDSLYRAQKEISIFKYIE
jgi:hypothetical protein